MSHGFRLALWLGIANCAALGWGQVPGPVLNSIFPAGGSPGTRLTIRVDGSQLEDLRAIWCSDPRWRSGPVQDGRGEITIPADAEPGVYDLRVVGKFGISGPRAFLVTRGPDQVDTEPNDGREQAQFLGAEAAVNGRFDKPGDVDCFAFSARARERLHIELWSNRLDAPTHGVLEVFDSSLRRLAVNRGDAGIDPVIDFVAPTDGRYIVRLFDQTYAGGNDYVYRLLVSTRPHVAYVMPTVAQVGQPLQVTLVGLNLTRDGGQADAGHVAAGRTAASQSIVGRGWESLRLDVTPTIDRGALRLPRLAHEFGTQPFALRVPGVDLPCVLGLTDVPVYDDGHENHLLEHAVVLEVPAEVSGQLIEGDEHDWYALRGRQGDVWWLEAFGDRLGAPIDLDLVLTDERQQERLRLTDELESPAGRRFPLHHSDPAGRFVVPADGTYFLMVRNLTGGTSSDPRRRYRLSVRREVPDFHLALVPHRSDAPTGWNVPLGGRATADIFVQRRRGLDGPIRIRASDLPAGVECPDVWVGAGLDHALLVVSAPHAREPILGRMTLTGEAEFAGRQLQRPVEGGTSIRAGHPMGRGRYTDGIPLASGPETRLVLTAIVTEGSVFQGSIVDVGIELQRGPGVTGDVRVVGADWPDGLPHVETTIPSGSDRGWLSIAIPSAWSPGPFSLVLQAETSIAAEAPGKPASPLVVWSNAITLPVEPGRIHLTIDPATPRRVARGEVIHVRYRAERKQGFIGKIHTELAAPGGVEGVRGRGVTFTGQTDTGEIQLIATENAPLGPLPFLRLDAVGTVEDKPVYRGGQFLRLEITE